MEYVDNLWLSLAEYFLLPALSALLDNIKHGCIEVSWLIPPHFMFQVIENLQRNTDFFKSKDIVEVFAEGECVYNGAHLDEQKKVSIGFAGTETQRFSWILENRVNGLVPRLTPL